jgi:FixJ family two-component response regulator
MSRSIRTVVTIQDEHEAVRHARGHVAVIDDDPSVCGAVAAMLRHEGYAVTEFASAVEFIAFEEKADPMFPGPRCLLLDVKMPSTSGLDLQRVLLDRGLAVPIVFMSGGSSAGEAVQAMKAGAMDFLIKPFDDEQLIDAVDKALLRSSADLRDSLSSAEIATRYASLSSRELQIARLVSQGYMNQQIADQLGIAERTVKLHRMHMMRKMGVGNVIELVRMLDAMH